MSDSKRDHLSEVRAAANRKGQDARWGAHRAARIAQGLPPTREGELGRKPRTISDPDVARYWKERVVELGIDRHFAATRGVSQITARQLNRLALLLSETEMARLAGPTTPALSEHDDKLAARIAYHRSEIERWKRRAEQERALIAEHERYATDHENTLADLLVHGLDE